MGKGVTSPASGDHAWIPLYTPECRACSFCLSRKNHLCQARFVTRAGPIADGHSAASPRKRQAHLFTTCGTPPTFSEYTVVPRDRRWPRSASVAPLEKVVPAGLRGCDHRIGRGAQHAQGWESRATGPCSVSAAFGPLRLIIGRDGRGPAGSSGLTPTLRSSRSPARLGAAIALSHAVATADPGG